MRAPILKKKGVVNLFRKNEKKLIFLPIIEVSSLNIIFIINVQLHIFDF